MTGRDGSASRARLVGAAAQLLEQRGYFGTGVAEVLQESGTPRGSLYFHFPGGKEELAAAALRESGAQTCAMLEAALASAPDVGAALSQFAAFFADRLERSDFAQGCPIVAVAAEGAPGAQVRDAVGSAIESWRRAIAARLEQDGASAARAAELATFVLSSMEGALLLSKALRDTSPLTRSARELARLLEASPRPDAAKPAPAKKKTRSATKR